jgi:membrane protein DedA with SNARE-associated domain
VSSHELNHLLHQYGCGLVFAVVALQALGAPLPGTTALIVAALYAATGHGLPIAGVIAAGALGALTGTTVGFAVGRWRGEALVMRLGRYLRQSPPRVALLRDEFAAHGSSLLFIGRFISGLRNVTGLLAGASGMPVRRFVVISTAAATAWALINGLEYYWFGHAIAAADSWVQVVLIAAGIGWLVVSVTVLRRRALRRLRAASTVLDVK